ncbi:FAD-binding oxidoreductase [Haliangium ochraceum]|uniref:FAD linked oxidase domain protein n=1 Tax=Haliangium ochraceum (strain DSM 14365 / JCM 11303 / SMP-2) TaxID=502025 RepID=D0LH07_HALO1|nr:FAD-linked oxidase C-terminal domain-containing protein [Haliangium ochraceum]ACY14729.1 FAD linked oxidase domain protein [Haliangium ochraceum DSM 14365]
MSAPQAVDITALLVRELGAERVIEPDPSSDSAETGGRLALYGRDESGMEAHLPACAVLCEQREQVEAVLRLAAEHRVPVTPRGAGSGKAGGCVPVRGGIVLSTENMRAVREIDGDDLVTVVEPGVITGALQDQVEAQGLFFPPDPASLGYCTIGGNAATNAGGPRAFKYGVTGSYVRGLEVVLMGGEVLRMGRRTAKGVTGYDLCSGFVGSEGTFGVITEMTLGLLPKPAAVATTLASFAEVATATAAIRSILGSGFRPCTMELADRTALDHVRPHARYRLPVDAGAILLVELDGEPEGLRASITRLSDMCEAAGALDVVVAEDDEQRALLWEARRLISSSLKLAHPHKISEDICVPRGAMGEMLRRIDGIAARSDLPFACYGHAGDGNLHVNLLLERPLRPGADSERVENALAELFRETIALRGTLTGEHGIGALKRRFMPLEHSPRLLEWQRRLKQLWDPHELLNPGKVLPARQTGCHE